MEKVLTYAGDDSIVHTVTIYPELWEGSVRIKPDLDSMLPESRSEKQARITTLYQMGMWGPPGTPEAVKMWGDLLNFPQMNRVTAIAGGVDKVTCQQAMGLLVRGQQAVNIPVLPWYNLMVWQATLTEFMSSPEYLKLQPPMQQEFVNLYEKVQAAQVAQQLNLMRQQAPVAAIHQQLSAHVAAAGGQGPAAPHPQLPPGGPPHGGGGKASVPPPHEAALQPTPGPINTPNPVDAQ